MITSDYCFLFFFYHNLYYDSYYLRVFKTNISTLNSESNGSNVVLVKITMFMIENREITKAQVFCCKLHDPRDVYELFKVV